MYFVFDIVWSQTDKDTVIVSADSKKDAEQKLRVLYPRAFYYNCIREVRENILTQLDIIN